MVGSVVVAALVPAQAAADGPTCSAWDVEYALAGTMRLADTTMGAADGTFPVGPGRAVVRFDDHGGGPGGHARLTAYSRHEHVTITTRAFFLGATLVTDTNSHAAGGGNGVVTAGNLAGTTLTWAGPMSVYRTDGTTTCEGTLCGKFGAPPPGSSEVHIGPRAVQLAPFQFAPDLKTFSMHEVQTAHAESPKQTTFEAISGREMKRTCVP
ncbi:MAG TPA: hypothetical protein VIY73_29385 [Polyangiaceae bacterium]